MKQVLQRASRQVGAALGALLVGATSALAQGIDLSRGGPVEVTARDGMEWRQNEQMVVARGDARAVRGGVTVMADNLIARYRRKPGSAAPAAGAQPGAADTGSNEIYRLEAQGHVRIATATDLAVGDRAVYDIDQAVLVLTGGDLRLTTPQQTLTAEDSMEYWSDKGVAVARGDATVQTADGRRLSADTLVGYTVPPSTQGSSLVGAQGGARPAAAGGDPSLAAGRLQRVEAFGNVVIRTAAETVRGDRGVYVPDSGIARLAGNVRITRGQNQLNGDEAVVNIQTGVSTLARGPGGRVQGLVVPNDPANSGAPALVSPVPGSPAPGGAPSPARARP